MHIGLSKIKYKYDIKNISFFCFFRGVLVAQDTFLLSGFSSDQCKCFQAKQRRRPSPELENWVGKSENEQKKDMTTTTTTTTKTYNFLRGGGKFAKIVKKNDHFLIVLMPFE
jgi:hypothetical protein